MATFSYQSRGNPQSSKRRSNPTMASNEPVFHQGYNFDQQLMNQQTQMLNIQQREMELQLQQMQLQSLVLQERIRQQQQQHQFSGDAQYQAPQSAGYNSTSYNRSNTFPQLPVSDSAPQQAVVNQHRLQPNLAQSAGPSAFPDAVTSNRGPRLSFGSDARSSLAASALARRTRDGGAVEDVNDDKDNAQASASAPTRTKGGHHRRSSSAQSTFSNEHTLRSNGPTLVLSKPGEYHNTSAPADPGSLRGAKPTAKRITVPVQRHSKHPSNSSASSASSGEATSFDSATTFASSTGEQCLAPADKFSTTAKSGRRPISIGPGIPQSDYASLSVSSKETSDNTLRPTSPMNFQRSLSSSFNAVATRQPKGPAKEEEMEVKNFAVRIRRKAIGSLRVGEGRRSSALVPPDSPNRDGVNSSSPKSDNAALAPAIS